MPWCRRWLDNTGQSFVESRYQAEIARWLRLPHLVLPPEVACEVSAWVEHPFADFQEQVALYLPQELLNLYMNVFTNYFLLYLEPAVIRRCNFRNSQGLLCCDKIAQDSDEGPASFCSWKHAAQGQWIVSFAFQCETDYGHDYLSMQPGDLIVGDGTSSVTDGWQYGCNSRTLQAGWFPPNFARPTSFGLKAGWMLKF